jgi:RimJ/RimL family protein N-acetyltransferase
MNHEASQATRDTTELAVTLRDGSQAVMRPVSPADKPLFAAAYERLSLESRRRRFLAAPSRLTAEDLRYFTEADHQRHVALIALDAETGEMVADARYVRLPGERDCAEVATFVADEWQRRGLATALLTELTNRARENGLRRFTALVSADNRVVLEALEKQGARHKGTSGGEVELEIELLSEGPPARLLGALRWAGEGQLRLLGGLARRLNPWSSS